MRTFYEPQVAPLADGGFGLTIRITTSAHPDAWTSPMARLNATAWEDAHAEARAQVAALRRVCSADEVLIGAAPACPER